MTLRVAAGLDDSLLFENPLHIWAPSTLEGAFSALEEAERALREGLWIAGALSYEFGALMHGITAREPDVPLVLSRGVSRAETAEIERRRPL